MCLHPSLAEVYRNMAARLEEALNDESIKVEAGDLLRPLIEAVTVSPAADGGLEIELKGAIAEMVALTLSDAKNRPRGAAVLGAFGCSVKVVAGARNHRESLLVVEV